MDYARFEREGWPIGSGAVEATCKHLVKERFCVTGARSCWPSDSRFTTRNGTRTGNSNTPHDN